MSEVRLHGYPEFLRILKFIAEAVRPLLLAGDFQPRGCPAAPVDAAPSGLTCAIELVILGQRHRAMSGQAAYGDTG